jgi:hypothetical protein
VVHVLTRANDIDAEVRRVERYLPTGWTVVMVAENANEFGDSILVIEGFDNAGWTAEDNVVPRLQSGLFGAEVIR